MHGPRRLPEIAVCEHGSLCCPNAEELAAAAQVLNTEDDAEPHPASIPTACPPWSSAFHQLKTFGCEHETRNGTK